MTEEAPKTGDWVSPPEAQPGWQDKQEAEQLGTAAIKRPAPAREPTMPAPFTGFDANTATFHAALAKAQAEFKPVAKSKTVTVRPRKEGAREYTFNYAPLEDVLDACVPALTKYGIMFSQHLLSRGGRRYLVTGLYHESGAYRQSVLELPDAHTPQEIGSMVTYMRRYAAQTELGINAEDDDDANAAEGNSYTPNKQTQQKWRK